MMNTSGGFSGVQIEPPFLGILKFLQFYTLDIHDQWFPEEFPVNYVLC